MATVRFTPRPVASVEYMQYTGANKDEFKAWCLTVDPHCTFEDGSPGFPEDTTSLTVYRPFFDNPKGQIGVVQVGQYARPVGNPMDIKTQAFLDKNQILPESENWTYEISEES